MLYKPYHFLEHTADIKMRATGRTLQELFVNAALGMMEVLYGEKIHSLKPSTTDHIDLDLASQDTESLLVDWLSELLYLSDANNCAYIQYEIQELADANIKATIYGLPAQAIDDIKAVTYHGLEVVNKGGRWEAIIVFDV